MLHLVEEDEEAEPECFLSVRWRQVPWASALLIWGPCWVPVGSLLGLAQFSVV